MFKWKDSSLNWDESFRLCWKGKIFAQTKVGGVDQLSVSRIVATFGEIVATFD